MTKAGVKPTDLKGKTLELHIEQTVCTICRAGLPGTDVAPGVLRQFSLKYPDLTIKVTAEDADEILWILNGLRVKR
jgi:hypothetical protein